LFLVRALPFLMQREIENSIILGGALQAAANPLAGGPFFATIELASQIQAVAYSSNTHTVWITASFSGCAAMLAKDLSARPSSLPQEICAQSSVALEFIHAMQELTGASYKEDDGLRIYQSQNVILPKPVPGSLRLAGTQDLPLLLGWASAFGQDVNYGDDAALHDMIKSAVRDQCQYIWQTTQPVAMLMRGCETQNSERVRMVYTPPEYRGQGYSIAANAALAALILQRKKTVCLSASMSNRASNAMYLKLGYSPLCELSRYVLTATS
jgi:uncharacterized protein